MQDCFLNLRLRRAMRNRLPLRNPSNVAEKIKARSKMKCQMKKQGSKVADGLKYTLGFEDSGPALMRDAKIPLYLSPIYTLN